MASIQSYLLDFWIRRLKLFGNPKRDLPVMRKRLDGLGDTVKPHPRVQVISVAAGSVPSEWLIPPDAPQDSALLYIHGGAWSLGSAKSHRAFVSRIAYAARIRALSINYRLAPEYPFPAGLEDCIEAYQWLVQQGIAPGRIVVAGDSAGGNLSLALLVALRDAGKPLPAGAVGISPAPDLAWTGESHRTRLQADPFFGHANNNRIVEDYIGHGDPRQPLVSPLYADLRGLPPLLLHVGDHEVLRDDVVNFGKRASEAGVDATTVVWPGMFHVFQIFGALLPEARQANRQIAQFIRARLEDTR